MASPPREDVRSDIPITKTPTNVVAIHSKLTKAGQASPPWKKIGPYLTIAQLISLSEYLRLLAETAWSGDGIVPKVFAVSELVHYLPMVIDFGINVAGQFLCNAKEREPYIMVGDDVEGVDILITTCKEPVEVVLDTVAAACTVDWPRDKFRVVVCDDGADENLKKAVASLCSDYNNLFYHSRPKVAGQQVGFKSGNINAALRYLGSAEFKGEPHPWVGILDADMIPDRSMLRELMAYTTDSRVGLVGLPQDFYNIPVNDPLHQNLIIQHEAEQKLRDKFDAAWCVGSGFVLKREALEKIGGFSETSMAEDLLLGWTLNGRGYKTVLCNQRLQCGLQPSSFTDHIKQRRRWFVGGMRNAKELSFGIKNPKFKNMSGWQKVAAYNQIPKPFIFAISKTVALFLVVLCLASGREVVNSQSVNGLILLTVYYNVFQAISRLQEYKSPAEYDIRNIRRRQIVGIWQGLHIAKATWVENMPEFLGGRTTGWAVSGAKQDTHVQVNERVPKLRSGMYRRMTRLNRAEKLLNHFYLFLLLVGLTVWHVHLKVTEFDGVELAYRLAVSTLFPGLRVEMFLVFISPIWYALFPPTEKPRLEYMYKDVVTGFNRPKDSARGARFTRSMYFWEVLIWTAFVWDLAALWVIVNHQ